MPAKPSGRAHGQPKTAFQHLKDTIKWVDLVFEVRDARLPLSSQHPKAGEIFGSKPRLIILTKEDLADPRATQAFIHQLAGGTPQSEAPHPSCIALSLKSQSGKNKVVNTALAMTEERREALKRKGLLPRPMRVCVVGLPNVGKSSLINWLIGQKKAKVADRPGITRGPQWVRVHPQLELLDTPGLLPPESFSGERATRLALANLIPEKSYDVLDVARWALDYLHTHYPNCLQENFPGLPTDNPTLESIAHERKFLATGGHLDATRAAQTVINDIRSGRLGRISLDSRA